MKKNIARLGAPAAALFALLLASTLAGCATFGDPGPAICHADDGTMVPVNDSRCPQAVRDALHHDAPPPESVDQSIDNELYNAQHGYIPGDAHAR